MLHDFLQLLEHEFDALHEILVAGDSVVHGADENNNLDAAAPNREGPDLERGTHVFSNNRSDLLAEAEIIVIEDAPWTLLKWLPVAGMHREPHKADVALDRSRSEPVKRVHGNPPLLRNGFRFQLKPARGSG